MSAHVKVMIIAASIGLAGCATTLTPISNNTDITKIDFSKVSIMKSGRSCASTYLLIFGPFGTQSLVNAAMAGKLTKVQLVDQKPEGGFFVSSHCTIAYGQ